MMKLRREILDKRLRELNITVDKFKDEVDVDRRTLERILSGKTKKPHPRTVEKMSLYLAIPHQELFHYFQRNKNSTISSDEFSPFVLNSPVIHPQYFHGRTEIIRKLSQLWNTVPLQNAAIVGSSGLGKTSLFNYLISISGNRFDIDGSIRVNHRKSLSAYKWLYLDFSVPKLSSPGEIYREILLFLEPDTTYEKDIDENAFFDILENVIFRSKVILILDEIDVALSRSTMLDNMFWEGMRHVSSEYSKYISFILGSKFNPFEYASSYGISSPFFNIFGYRTELGPLETCDALEMFKSSPEEFSSEDCQWIIENSLLYPRVLQFFCWELLETLTAGKFNAAWREEAIVKSRDFSELH